MNPLSRKLGIVCGMMLLAACASFAQQNYDSVQIKTNPLRGNVYELMGAGGNMTVCVGTDGTLLVDDDAAQLTTKIQAAIAVLSPNPVKFVVNTHWHGDHTGGNENFHKAGATIVAHENIRKQMAVEHFMKMFNFTTPASPEDALPTVTFNDSISFHMNGEDIQVFHVPNAHTDGDGLVHYVKNNIIQTGDTYFNGIYPYIDLGVGGSIEGMIKSGHRVIDLADDATIIIPGHGKISNKKELATFVKMLETIRDNVKKLIDAGKSSDEVVAAKPTKEYDAVWGNGFMKPDVFAGIVYTSLGGK